MVFFGVEGHGGLFDLSALFRHVDRLGQRHLLGKIQRGGNGVSLASGRKSGQGVSSKAPIPAAGLSRVEVGPQSLAAGFECLSLGRVEHIQRRSGWTLSDRAFHAADPERITGVFQAAVSIAVGFTAIHQSQRANGPGATTLMLAVVIIVPCCNQGFTHSGHHSHLAWHRRHGLAGQRYDCRNRGACDDFSVGQCPGASGRFTTAQGKRLSVITVAALL